MRVKPLHDWIVVEPDEAVEQSAGGIIIPDVAKEKPESGKVVAVGGGKFVEEKDAKGKVKEKKFVKMTVAPGEHVFYEKWAAKRVQIDLEEVVMVREEDVLGYLIGA
ncbi:MAG: co-chaperone GroES [Candidatus Manganitrophaceae bacterium]